MADLYWIGGATAVAQVATGSIDSLDGTPSNNTFTLTVGDASVSAAGDTDVGTTAAALVSAANSSTHPHMAAVTWTNPSGGDVTGTADTAGVPFVAALTVSGAGSGTVTDFSDDTASAGPTDYSTGANWDTGSAPASADDVTIDKSGERILFGLDQSGVALNSFRVRGNVVIGLDSAVFTDTVDESAANENAVEYRQSYLKIDSDVIEIGQWQGAGAVTASQRTKIEQASTAASTITVFNTASTASEASLPPCRLLAADADCDIELRNGLVGVAIENNETATVGEVFLIDTDGDSRCLLGAGVTLTNYEQRSGIGLLQAAATVTSVACDGGTLTIEGDFTITTMTMRDGICFDNHLKTGGNCVTTLNLDGGTLDMQRSRLARTVATLNHEGGTLLANDNLTITTYNEPSEGDYQLTAA